MMLSIFSFMFLAISFIASITEASSEVGAYKSFAPWVYSIIIAVISVIFYTVDAVFSIIKIFKKIHPVFNSILALILIAAIPMVIYVGGSLGINVYIWFSYYLLMFALEIVSIIKHIKMMKNTEKCVIMNPRKAVEI